MLDNIEEQIAKPILDTARDQWKLTAKPKEIAEGGLVILELKPPQNWTGTITNAKENITWEVAGGKLQAEEFEQKDKKVILIRRKWDTSGLTPSTYWARVKVPDGTILQAEITVTPRLAHGDTLTIQMARAAAAITPDQALWVVIRNSTKAISFKAYEAFVNNFMCGPGPGIYQKPISSNTPFPFVNAYKVLKETTELFLLCNCGVVTDFSQLVLDLSEESLRLRRKVDSPAELERLWQFYCHRINQTDKILPYLDLIRREKLKGVPLKTPTVAECYGILQEKLLHPCLLELIWSYWLEEGMLIQTMNAISLRFQNRRLRPGPDPLARLDLDPLRPLNNLLWGYIQDEQHRLTLARRAYEYDHLYGLKLVGKAVPPLETVDSRSKFLEAFHNLLYVTANFYRQDDDTMVVADGFPVLNALKEVHLLLAEGAHNQFGDLPSTARMEMLIMQWLLARPEMREFLSSRIMIPYPEAWMDRVDTMKKLQGWTDVSVIHFRDLAEFGEQILLSIRYGSWIEINQPENAANWARYWRPEIQRYIHAYRAVTGVDLASEAMDPQQTALRYLPPAVHLQRRLTQQGLSR